jgi:predicted membrane protein
MRKKMANILLGLILIGVGVAYAGNVLELWRFSISFDGWWTLFIIVPCIFSILREGFKFINLTGVSIGVVFLLTEQDIIKNDLGYKLVIPIVIIALGLSIIFKRTFNVPENFNAATNIKGNDFYAILGGNSPNFHNAEFRGANCYAILGGIEMHLNQAIIKENCVINVTSVLGGTDIYLPTNVKIVLNSTPILGGVENKFISSNDPNAPTVLINAVSVLGGTEIK